MLQQLWSSNFKLHGMIFSILQQQLVEKQNLNMLKNGCMI